MKKVIENKKGHYNSGVISDEVKDHGNDPFVVKKLEEAKAFLKKNGLNGLPGYSKK